jgi:chanoclavine-I dehydrogenase
MAQGAGIRHCPTILEEEETQWKRIFQVNLDGVFYATKAEVRAMKPMSRDRSIVNVASIASMAHMPDVFAYGTSKGACAYFTTCVAQDVIPFGIRVNTVSPGDFMVYLYEYVRNITLISHIRNYENTDVTQICPHKNFG